MRSSLQEGGETTEATKERKVVTVDTAAALEHNDLGPSSAAFDTPAASQARQLTHELESVLERNAAKGESTNG